MWALLLIPFLFVVTLAQAEEWQGLTVAPENRCSPYESADYPYPQSLEPLIVDRQAGLIYSPYDGRFFPTTDETDIEHIVAKSEAHDSGLCGAGREIRRMFAADLDNLTLAAPRLNRYEKRDNDAAEWLPPQSRCWYVRRIIFVKQKYRLSVDEAERDALAQVLNGCEER